MDTRTQAHHLSLIPSPMHILQGPKRGLHAEKEYSRTWVFFVCFLLKEMDLPLGCWRKAEAPPTSFCAVVTSPPRI